MKISCLIPVYNGERFLRAALDSILCQTFQDFDVIVVDDGSTDGSPLILNSYGENDPRVKIYRKENGGIVSALNYGLQYCTGDYVARMDCDDIALPRRFQLQLAEFDKRPDAVAVGGYIRTIDEDDNVGPSLGVSPSRVTKTSFESFPLRVANVQHSAGTFLRSAMVGVGGYRSTFKHAEDYDLYLRLAPFGRFYNPPEVVILYRKHSSSLSARNLLEQETNAALAEISAYARKAGVTDPGDNGRSMTLLEYNQALGDNLCPVKTVQRYIEFRMLRRTRAYGLPEAAVYWQKVRNGVLDFRNYRSRMDRQINMRIISSLGRHWLKNVPRGF